MRRIRCQSRRERADRWKGLSALLCSVILSTGLMAGCSPLEPINEPEISDLQLTVDTLKTSVRDAQRTIAELRTEAEARRQDLADAHVARAQFEGRVREAERRLVEARHVIDLQRDELAASRTERDRVARMSASLQNQLKQLQRQLSKIGDKAEHNEGRSAVPAHFPIPNGRPLGQSPPGHQERASVQPTRNAAVPKPPSEQLFGVAPRPVQAAVPVRVIVKPGDTLWNISQRFRVGIKRLREINQLTGDRIEVGQAVWLAAPPDGGTDSARIE